MYVIIEWGRLGIPSVYSDVFHELAHAQDVAENLRNAGQSCEIFELEDVEQQSPASPVSSPAATR